MCANWQIYMQVMSEQEHERVIRALLLNEPIRFDYYDVLRWEQLLTIKQWKTEARFQKSMAKSLINYDHAKPRQPKNSKEIL